MDNSIDTSADTEVDETFSVMFDELERAENFLAQGDIEGALPTLSNLRDVADAVIADLFVADEKTQYFSFPSMFDRLAYRRVEEDPRELIDPGFPFDRLYSDYAFAQIHSENYEAARDALAQAVRWNPMDCAYRLDLAELYRILGNIQEWAALSFSVFERATDPRHLARAYNNVGIVLVSQDKIPAAVGCLKVAEKMIAKINGAASLTDPLAGMLSGKEIDVDSFDEQTYVDAMESEGIPEGANAEMAICLIMCATDLAQVGHVNEATHLTIRARDLVGEQACRALIALVRGEASDTDAEKDGE